MSKTESTPTPTLTKEEFLELYRAAAFNPKSKGERKELEVPEAVVSSYNLYVRLHENCGGRGILRMEKIAGQIQPAYEC